MNVHLNGTLRTVEGSSTVEAAAVLAGIDSGERGVAIAVDGAVVPRSAWSSTALRDGQRVEIVRATAGG